MTKTSDAITTFEQALAALGVAADTLTPAERAALDANGFVVLREVVPPAQLDALRERLDQVVADESGTRHATALLDHDGRTGSDGRGSLFLRAALDARVLAAAHHVLRRRFRLGALSGREPTRGSGQQALHPDWMAPARDGQHAVATALWLLDDFRADNGATRVVPGSHRRKELPPKELADLAAHHPRETIVTAPAGAVLFFNGHLLHSGTRNVSGARRRVLQGIFVGAESSSYATPPITTPERLAPAERFLLGLGLGLDAAP